MKSQIAVQIDAETHKRLKAYAAMKGTSLRALLEDAIQNMLYEEPMRVDIETINTNAKREFELSMALQAEFKTVEIYQAYRRGVATGSIRPPVVKTTAKK